MLTNAMKDELIKGLLNIFSDDIKAIILYGSVARNESRSGNLSASCIRERKNRFL